MKVSTKRFPDLAAGQAYYLERADQAAEVARLKLITSGNGQAMTYEAKHREALAGGGPFLKAEAQALGITEQQVAESVLAARAEWERVGIWIEAERLKAKQAIRAATSAGDMHTIVRTYAALMGA